MRYQRIDLVGFRVFHGGAYKISASVSLHYPTEQTYRQLDDAYRRMAGVLKLTELEWRITKENVHALKMVFQETKAPGYDPKHGTLFGRPIRLKEVNPHGT